MKLNSKKKYSVDIKTIKDFFHYTNVGFTITDTHCIIRTKSGSTVMIPHSVIIFIEYKVAE